MFREHGAKRAAADAAKGGGAAHRPPMVKNPFVLPLLTSQSVLRERNPMGIVYLWIGSLPKISEVPSIVEDYTSLACELLKSYFLALTAAQRLQPK